MTLNEMLYLENKKYSEGKISKKKVVKESVEGSEYYSQVVDALGGKKSWSTKNKQEYKDFVNELDSKIHFSQWKDKYGPDKRGMYTHGDSHSYTSPDGTFSLLLLDDWPNNRYVVKVSPLQKKDTSSIYSQVSDFLKGTTFSTSSKNKFDTKFSELDSKFSLGNWDKEEKYGETDYYSNDKSCTVIVIKVGRRNGPGNNYKIKVVKGVVDNTIPPKIKRTYGQGSDFVDWSDVSRYNSEVDKLAKSKGAKAPSTTDTSYYSDWVDKGRKF